MKYYFYNEDIAQKSIGELLKMLEAGEVNSEELVWAYTERIASLDNAAGGPQLHGVRELNPDAFQIARERDWERRKGELRGPLHGIPILLKDSIDTGDKTRTTCGSMAMREHRAEKDAFIVKNLREAGAIILGKNYCTEFYGYSSLDAPNGYSSLLDGAPVNPFSFQCRRKLKPGGSSGGSAVSVAADMTAAAIGTDTAGSIFEPAYVNGVVGYKPTVGLTSRTGILPIMMCQDAAGPITRNVEDAARIADVIIARDPEDTDTIRAEAFADARFLEVLNGADLRGKRFGIVREGYYEEMDGLGTGADPTEADLTEQALSMLERAGATIIEVKDFLPAQILAEPDKYPERLDYEVMNRAFKVRFDHYLATQKDLPFHSLKELIDWNRAHPENIPIGQSYLEMVAALCEVPVPTAGDKTTAAHSIDPVTTPEFVRARMNDLDICGTRGVWGAFENYGLDVLILPGLAAQGIAATAGNPTITIPAGYSEATGPVGITLVGELMGDCELLRIASACEKVLPPRPIPKL